MNQRIFFKLCLTLLITTCLWIIPSLLFAETLSVSRPAAPSQSRPLSTSFLSSLRNKLFPAQIKLPSQNTSVMEGQKAINEAAPFDSLQQLRMNYKVMIYNNAQLAALQAQVKKLQLQLNAFQSPLSYRTYWFTAGAITVFIGFLFGLLISALWSRRQKR